MKKKKEETFIIKPIPGINSMVSETLAEIAKDLNSIAKLERVIKELDKDLLPLIVKIKEKGITDTQAAISLFLAEEASENINMRKSLINELIDRKAVVFLPLPPHIFNTIISAGNKELIYNSEDKIPPHLHNYNIPQLTELNSREIIEKIGKAESLIMDGQVMGDNRLYIRSVVANILGHLRNIKKIFFHKIPHIPKGQYFIEFDTSKQKIKLVNI